MVSFAKSELAAPAAMSEAPWESEMSEQGSHVCDPTALLTAKVSQCSLLLLLRYDGGGLCTSRHYTHSLR